MGVLLAVGLYVAIRLGALPDELHPPAVSCAELGSSDTHEQGLAKRRLKVDEIFHPSTLELSEA